MPDALAPQPPAATPLSPGGAPGALMQEMQSQDAQTQGILSKENADIKPAMDNVSSLLAAPRPQSPALQAQPESPKMKEEQAQNAHEFLSSAVLLAGIAGALSRSHVTTALNAFGATIKGYREGQLQAGQQAFEEFKSASDAVKSNNDAMQRAYQNALSDRKASLDEQMARVQMVAAQYHDQLMAQAASAKNYLLVGQLMERQNEAGQKFQEAYDKLEQQHDQFDAKIKAGLAQHGLKQDDDGNVVADPEAAAGIQATRTPRSAQAMALQKYMQENPNASADDLANFGATYAARTKAVSAFATGKQGDIVRSFNTATEHLNTLDKLTDALNNGNSVAFNRIANSWKTQFGVSSAPNNFETAKQIVGDEIVKAIVGAGGGAGDREKAQAVLDAAKTPQQLKDATNTLRELIHGQLVGLQKQFVDTKVGTEEDFQKRLSGAARKMIGGGDAGAGGADAAKPIDLGDGVTAVPIQ